MSKYNKYVKQVDEIARKVFSEYREAERAYNAAERKMKDTPERPGLVTAEYATKAARAKADYIAAKNVLDEKRAALFSAEKTISDLRRGLADEIETSYGIDPAKYDGPTIELVKSGIMSAADYNRLIKRAAEGENSTMARLLGKYAGEAAKSRIDKAGGVVDEEARALQAAAMIGNDCTGGKYLQTFDRVAEVYGHCVKNPRMIDHWGEFTAETVENF